MEHVPILGDVLIVPAVVETENENKTGQVNQLKAWIEESLSRLAQALDDQQASAEMRRYLDLLARFHKYSWRNCLLIASAKPESTLVAGFNRWKKIGRKVRKGEKAIRIFAPCPIVTHNEDNEEVERVFFKTACVFDVSQTEGTELPTLEVPEIQVQGDDLLHRLEQVAVQRGIQVTYQPFKEGMYGVSKGGAVEIAQGYSTGQQAKSLAHEIAHEALHKSEDRMNLPRGVMELEAEAVAYVVCRHFGLDVELRASRYISLWGGDSKALAKSLDRISRTARDVIEGVEESISTPQASTSSLFYAVHGSKSSKGLPTLVNRLAKCKLQSRGALEITRQDTESSVFRRATI